MILLAAYPPIPQQLGSVTFRAADVATAASAEKIHGREVRLWLTGRRSITCIATLPEDLEAGLYR